REEVDAAWTAYRTQPTAEARDVIVERYIHLVRYMARRLGRALPPSVDTDDLVGAGIEGFLGAVERFDPEQGTDFSVYALTRIRGAMVDFVREIDPVGRTTRRRLREAGRAVAALEQDRGREISDAEAAEHLGLSMDRFHELMTFQAAGSPLSLERLEGGDEDHRGAAAHGRLADRSEGDALGQVLDSERAYDVVALVSGLPRGQQLVLQLYYVEDLNFREIAMIMDISESRATQLHTAAVQALRSDGGCLEAAGALAIA
ncbi:MAG TPA: FliA/WhiG family RNA polymerase sigma factor, partial [Methylomirabilota bacterium]|nr:FliA/WhiG family RNA polymerase sigma factor [Methylomirabilota bacterium]